MLLGIASGLSVFGMAIVVPSMSSIAQHYDADFSTVQFIISAYLFGLAIAQPISGFLCDRFGRRPVMLAGFALFSFASLLCALAPSLSLLILARFGQALGVSVGTVTSRAILRDTRDDEKMTEATSYIAAAMGVAPVIAPIIGGLLESSFGYRSTFIVTAAMGLTVLLAMRWRLSETLKNKISLPNWSDLRSRYAVLLKSSKFVGYTLIYGFQQGAFFAFLAVGAAFFEMHYAMDSKTFGLIWGALALAYVGGATIGGKMTPRVGAEQVMHISLILAMIVGVWLLYVAMLNTPTAAQILIPLILLMLTSGSATPGAMAGAVRYHPEAAGTAAGLSSALGLMIGGSFTIVSGAVYSGDFTSIALLMFFACVGGMLCWWLLADRPAIESTGQS